MRKSQLAVAVATAMGASAAAHAVNVAVDLIQVASESSNGSSAAVLTTNTATWSYNTSSGVVTGTGTVATKFQISPAFDLFTNTSVDLAIGAGGAAGATSYNCTDGAASPAYLVGYCGNYNYGSNGNNESTVSYGPGTAFSKTIGGDDVNSGPQQSIHAYDGMTTSWNGTTLVISNAVPGVGGQTWTFQAQVPVPAAVWLFGSALGLLGWVRRRASV